jgi:hypothetical protein
LKLKCDELLSNAAFKSNLRRFIKDGSWLPRARQLLEARPALGLIGGRAGRLDVNDRLEQKKPEWKLEGRAPAWVAGPMWQVWPVLYTTRPDPLRLGFQCASLGFRDSPAEPTDHFQGLLELFNPQSWTT